MPAATMFRSLLFVTGAITAPGLVLWAHWMLTGDFAAMRWYFDYPVELFLVFAPAAQLLSARMVSLQFLPDEPMHRAWRLAAWAAALQFTGGVIVHGLATSAAWSPILALGGSPQQTEIARRVGSFLAGPVALLVLGLALHRMWRLSLRCGMPGGWRAGDVLVLIIGAAALVRHLSELTWILTEGVRVDWSTQLGWPTEPVLMYVLVISIRLSQVARELGGGLVARCWQAYAAGVMLIFLGDIGIWLQSYFAGAWPWNSLFWYVWLPAAGALAVAPSLYWTAIAEAGRAESLDSQPLSQTSR